MLKIIQIQITIFPIKIKSNNLFYAIQSYLKKNIALIKIKHIKNI